MVWVAFSTVDNEVTLFDFGPGRRMWERALNSIPWGSDRVERKSGEEGISAVLVRNVQMDARAAAGSHPYFSFRFLGSFL